jgi:hypothetical protein
MPNHACIHAAQLPIDFLEDTGFSCRLDLPERTVEANQRDMGYPNG